MFPRSAREYRRHRELTASESVKATPHNGARRFGQCFDTSESMKNAGILDVFPIFHTARLGQKIRRSLQLPPKRCCLKPVPVGVPPCPPAAGQLPGPPPFAWIRTGRTEGKAPGFSTLALVLSGFSRFSYSRTWGIRLFRSAQCRKAGSGRSLFWSQTPRRQH